MERLRWLFVFFGTLITTGLALLVAFLVVNMTSLGEYVYLFVIPAALFSFLFFLLFSDLMLNGTRKLIKAVHEYAVTGTFETHGLHEGVTEVYQLADSIKQIIDESEKTRSNLTSLEQRQMELISDIAHELRTPLTAIRGNAELLMDPDLPPDLHERFCCSIIRESERLTELTHDLTDLQKTDVDMNDAKQWNRIDLKMLCREAIDALEPVLRKHDAQVTLEGEAPDVLGNPSALKRVVSNLVDNATHFIEDGGHIAVEVFGMNQTACISVKDDGCGFGDVDPNLLFQRFYRTDVSRARNTGGSGLGLAIVKAIVEAHDGEVMAYNRPEGGACFVVSLPAIKPGM